MAQESAKRAKLDSEPRGDGAQEEHRSFNTIVGEAIRRARLDHGWTQAFLAEQAGLSPNYIARLERGELGPSLFVAARICEALEMELDGLVAPPPQGPAGARRTSKRRSPGP